MRRRLLRFLSRLSVRLLAFNLLLVFLPVAGMLFLDTYERHMLDAQERTMVQEGRLLAAALETHLSLDPQYARSLLVHLSQRHEARLRVVDRAGRVIADSARLGPRRSGGDAAEPAATGVEDSWIYRIGSGPFRLLRRLLVPAAPVQADAYDEAAVIDGREVRAALEGRYGAATRLSAGDQRSVTLYSAIPVRIDGRTAGVVLVSQSSSRVLRALYAVRVEAFRVFLASVAVAVLLSLVAATTIARPLARLRRRAGEILDRRGRLRGGFAASRRLDEIGDLERALAELTRRLEHHIGQMEGFAADVSHEFKNPLASIRNAVELAAEEDDPELRRHFLTLVQRDVARMERLLTAVREISRIDILLEDEEREPVPLSSLLAGVVEAARLRRDAAAAGVVLSTGHDPVEVLASPDRLVQVFENLVDNALSFSPRGGTVVVALHREADAAVVRVTDEGPGIAEEHLDRVFDRFFSYRPTEPGTHHTGLGLAIVRAIVEGYGGTVHAGNRSEGGAVLEVRLPAV